MATIHISIPQRHEADYNEKKEEVSLNKTYHALKNTPEYQALTPNERVYFEHVFYTSGSEKVFRERVKKLLHIEIKEVS